MMKKNALLLFYVFVSISWVFAQNLVANPSFEITSSCPMGPSQFTLATSWDDLNTNVGGDSCSSPDLYATCSWTIGGVNSPAGLLGYQNSRTGTHHAGIIVESRPPILSSCPPSGSSVDDYREYIGGQLTTPLVAGQSYCVQFYINLATKAGWGIDKIGCYFYNSSASIAKDFCASPTPITIPLSDPKLLMTSGTPFIDTVNWVLVNWNYVAQGGENSFAIGNFFDENTQLRSGNDCSSSNLQGGTYSYYFIDDVSVTSGTCCIATVIDPGVLCVGDAALNLTPLTSGGTFSGTGITNASMGTFDPSVAGVGTHIITYTLPCGSETLSITVNNCTSLSICQETNGDLTVSGGTAPYSWQSQSTSQDCSACLIGCTFPPGCAVNVTTWNTYAATATAAPGTLPIQVSDNAGNTEVITVLSSIPACSSTPCTTITVTSTVQAVSCFGGADGSATVSASGGTATYSYTWMPGGFSGVTQNALAANTYTVTVTDANGCTGTTSIVMVQPTALAASTSTTPSDCAANNGTASVTVSGGTSPYVYAWNPSGGNGVTASNLSSGVYSVLVTDAAGCTFNAQATVASNGGPVLSTVVNQEVSCFGGTDGSATATISGGTAPFSILWTPSGETSATANLLSAGSSTVIVTDAGGCSVSAVVQISQPNQIVIVESITDEDCGTQNGAISTTVTGGTSPYSYSWTGTSASFGTVSGLNDGNYSLTVIDASGCSASETYIVDQIGTLTVGLTPVSAVINQGDSVQLTASGGVNYSWTPTTGLSCTTCANPMATPMQTTIYQVTVSDASGCSGVETVAITVYPLCGDVFVPSIFSPNADGNNELLCAFGNCFQEVQFSIYNRWGERVFDTDDLSECWDATYKGKPVNSEVFVYKLTGVLITGEAVELSGNIQVVR